MSCALLEDPRVQDNWSITTRIDHRLNVWLAEGRQVDGIRYLNRRHEDEDTAVQMLCEVIIEQESTND